MKTLSTRILTFFGIALLAAVMVLSFASCQQDPSSGNDNKPEIPSFLQNTEWTNTVGDKISFDKNSVTITPSGGSPQKFPLKDTSSISQNGIEQTTLYFKDKQSTDNITTYQNDSIGMVNFSMIDILNRGGSDWSNDNNNNNNSTYSDFTYSYTASSATITGYTGNGGNVTIPAKIGGKPVVAIGDRAFENDWHDWPNNTSGSNKLTSVTIPNSVTSIESGAFVGNQLTSVTIPNSVTFIGNNAFAFNQLTSVVIPNNITSTGNNAFIGNKLTSVTIPNSVTSIESQAFALNQLTSITIPDSVTSIESGAFVSNQLTSITIPNSVTEIGPHAFASNQLTSVTIPSSITSISERAFANNQLTSVTIPNSVTEIGEYAFHENQLTSVTIGSNVIIDSYSFSIGFFSAYNENKAAGVYKQDNLDSDIWTKIN